MQKELPSFKIDRSRSLFLLGSNDFSRSPLAEYMKWMASCTEEGNFLSFKDSAEWLSCYSVDSQSLQSNQPLMIFRPHSASHIPSFLQKCHACDIPVSVRCGGTGLSGGCIPCKEGVVMLTGHLKSISDYDQNQGTLLAEPGVTVSQLNRFARPDGWHFPLSMATEGTAGLGGCLSFQSRGLHQQHHVLYEKMEWVLLADGRGEVLKVPPSFVCGAEGLWGVVLGIKLQLKKRALHRCYTYRGLWENVMDHFPTLLSMQALTGLVYHDESFYLTLEGEEWRLCAARAKLSGMLQGLKEADQKLPHFYPRCKASLMFSTALATVDLPEAVGYGKDLAANLGLELQSLSDVLAGTLHLILRAAQPTYCLQQIDQFLTAWAEFVEIKKGALASCQGIGIQMAPYMTPFWGEESCANWQKIKKRFDPKNIFARGRFFPPEAKNWVKKWTV